MAYAENFYLRYIEHRPHFWRIFLNIRLSHDFFVVVYFWFFWPWQHSIFDISSEKLGQIYIILRYKVLFFYITACFPAPTSATTPTTLAQTRQTKLQCRLTYKYMKTVISIKQKLSLTVTLSVTSLYFYYLPFLLSIPFKSFRKSSYQLTICCELTHTLT